MYPYCTVSLFLRNIIICQKTEKAVFYVYTNVFREFGYPKVLGPNANPSKNCSTYYRTFALLAKISFPLLIVKLPTAIHFVLFHALAKS